MPPSRPSSIDVVLSTPSPLSQATFGQRLLSVQQPMALSPSCQGLVGRTSVQCDEKDKDEGNDADMIPVPITMALGSVMSTLVLDDSDIEGS